MDGSDAMRKRPMLELLDCLQDLGCVIEYDEKEGHFPYRMYSNGLTDKDININAKEQPEYLWNSHAVQ